LRDGHGIKQVERRRHHRGHHLGPQVGRLSRGRARATRHQTRYARAATDKLAALTKLVKARDVSLEHCACVGDDTPDTPIPARGGAGDRRLPMPMPMHWRPHTS
jgi:3-deoxy-D-manno-octulosonate 8-phosphate phosphatase KdsC-like HAD superfamily phosphatase